MDERKVIYYEDELRDEFSVAVIEARRIDGGWRYVRDGFWERAAHLLLYRAVAMPIAFCYLKYRFGHRIVGAEKLKPYRGGGYFLFGNHTQDIGDALIPNMIDKSRDKYIIVHPNNVSIPSIGWATPYLGALPLPDTLSALRELNKAIDLRIGQGNAVVIYPEAHIWPYYTDIRPFGDSSFTYPVRLSSPCFSFTNVYKRRRGRKEPRMITYIDGPFFPDATLPPREARKKLRDEVYTAMKERAALSDVKVIEYIKKSDI